MTNTNSTIKALLSPLGTYLILEVINEGSI